MLLSPLDTSSFMTFPRSQANPAASAYSVPANSLNEASSAASEIGMQAAQEFMDTKLFCFSRSCFQLGPELSNLFGQEVTFLRILDPLAATFQQSESILQVIIFAVCTRFQ